MKPVIKNPVISSPWTINMPNNFRGSQAAFGKVYEPANFNIKVSFSILSINRRVQVFANH